MNPDHLHKLCKDFDIGNPAAEMEDSEGVLNTNYIVTTDRGKYFIKSVRDRQKENVTYISKVEVWMKEHGIPAVCMLKNTKGTTFVEYDTKVYTVYPFYESDRSHNYSLEDFQRMGEMLGRIHLVGSRDVPAGLQKRKFAPKSKEMISVSLKKHEAFILAKDNQDEQDKKFLEYIRYKLKLIPSIVEVVLPEDTLIHGDYHERNLLIDEQRKIIGVCDWEKAEIGSREYELVRALGIVSLSAEDDTFDIEKAKMFLNGYNAVYPIDKKRVANGIAARLQKIVLSMWIEHQHYDLKDARSNKFIPNEIKLIEIFSDKSFIERL